jgi:hypothetical protein
MIDPRPADVRARRTIVSTLPMEPAVLETLAAWAEHVAALPAEGPLPARTVLVPSMRQAHALRRALLRAGAARVLAGTRFLVPRAAAAEVLRAAGVALDEGEEGLRRARLLALVRDAPRLEHLDADLLRSTRGWDEALARAIGALEADGLTPAALPSGAAEARDLATIWRLLDAEAGASRTAARILADATALLQRDPRAWPLDGPVLAAVTGHEGAAEAAFVRAIPAVRLALRFARPVRPRQLARVEALFGAEARRALERVRPARAAATERDVLAACLFEPPEALASADRPRSRGADGTVHLEEHAGVEAEVEAAAEWVARQVSGGVALEEIAVLVPALDPLAQLVADRLERLATRDGPLPVHVAGGLPATGTAAGARILAVLRALRAHLSADALAAVLPALRLEGDPERDHLTHGEAMELAYALGTAGGNAGRPAGALEWSARAEARIPELERALAHARLDEDSAGREGRRLERTLRSLRGIRPAMDALVGVARAPLDGAPLTAIAGALGAFLERWLLAPGAGAAVVTRLAASLAPACAGEVGRLVRGADALDVVEDHLSRLRIARRRFGEPAVYVGTLASAAGLEHEAVRVVGLYEGVVPSPPREDPALPERVLEALEEGATGRVRRAADVVAEQLHALSAAVLGARREIVLSAPRVDLARTEREPASLFVEAAAALARPHPLTGAPARPVPDAAALRRDGFGPSRAAAAASRAGRPLTEGAWLDRVARVAADIPPAWSREGALALARVEALASPAGPLGPADGRLGPGDPFPGVPGLDAGSPISASGLRQLLECPRRFLLERILHWEEPAAAVPHGELDALAYGSLLHRVVEALYRAHGPEIVARARSREHWVREAKQLGDQLFDEFLSEYPLVGEGVREKERERLHESLRAFVEYDWDRPGGRRFVAVEKAFGVPDPLPLPVAGGTLHVRGYVDRVDVEDGTTVVRDLKSGRAHPRRGAEAVPTPTIDVQLGLYALAARELAGAWGTPANVAAAYVYASGRGPAEERDFRGADTAELLGSTRRWLDLAASLLRDRAFVPTPEQDDCKYCPYRPLCGRRAPARARGGLDGEDDGPLASFRDVKDGEEDAG